MEEVNKSAYPYGLCCCNGTLCCNGRGPASFEAFRGGQWIRLCSRCIQKSDERRLLVTVADDAQIFLDFDALGTYSLILNDLGKARS
jgi:hypothetical protein